MTSHITVYTMTIDHKHGTDTRVFRTQEAAHEALARWAREWWIVEQGSSSNARMTLEEFNALPDAEAIEVYFNFMADRECYCLDSAILEG